MHQECMAATYHQMYFLFAFRNLTRASSAASVYLPSLCSLFFISIRLYSMRSKESSFKVRRNLSRFMLTASFTMIVKAYAAYRNCAAVYHPAPLLRAEKHDISEYADFLRAPLCFVQDKKRAVTTLYNVSVTAHIELDF